MGLFGMRGGVIGGHGGHWSLADWEPILIKKAPVVSATITELPICHSGSVSPRDGNYKFISDEFGALVKQKKSKTRRLMFSGLPATDVNGLVLVQFREWIHTFALDKNLKVLGLRRGTHHELLVVGKLLPDLQKDHPILQHGNVEGLFGTALDFVDNTRGLTMAYYYAPTVMRHEPQSAWAYITPEQRILAAQI